MDIDIHYSQGVSPLLAGLCEDEPGGMGMFVVTRGSGEDFALPCDLRIRVVAVYGDHVELAFDGPADVQPCCDGGSDEHELCDHSLALAGAASA